MLVQSLVCVICVFLHLAANCVAIACLILSTSHTLLLLV